MKLLKISLVLLAVFFTRNCRAQTDSLFLGKVVTALERSTLTNPVEKVYLHLDRETYMPGDTLWFKAYTVLGKDHQLSTLSGALHVRLVNSKDSILQSITLNIAAGLAWGDMALPPTLKQGNYHLIAYTNWMRNAGAGYFFDRVIKVNQDFINAPVKPKKQTGKTDIQFFPEGGALVNGLRSKVAFKAVSENGLGEDIGGVIIDSKNNEVAVFKTTHAGMGVFALTPQAGESYKAKINLNNHDPFTVDLPKALDDGFVLSVNNNMGDSIGIRVAASDKQFKTTKDANYYLVAQSGGAVYFASGFKLSAQSFNAVINKKRLPGGIARFTLFTGNAEPLNERIVFIDRADSLKLHLNSNAGASAPRQRMKFDLDVSNAANKFVTGSFSVAVVNQDFAPVDELSQGTIVNNLLLISDIKGYVEQPNYYFTSVNADTKAGLDVLMLTQGYHRFEWKPLLSDTNPPPVFEPENTLQLSGYVKTLSGRPVPGAKVSLVTTTGGFLMLDTLTNPNGRFTFGLLTNENLKYVIQAKGKKSLAVQLDTLSSFNLRGVYNGPIITDTTRQFNSYQKQIVQQMKLSIDKRIIQLREVVIKGRKEPERDPFIHATNPDQVIRDFPQDGSGGSLATFLGSRLKSIQVRSSVQGASFYTYRSISQSPQPSPMMVKLDGAIIDPAAFSVLLISDIESAEVIRTVGQMDITTGAREVIYLISRRRTGTVQLSTPNVVTYQSNGFYKAREFYAPKYERVNESGSKPDLRTTIYWKPNLVTDNGKTSFEFFNADTKGTYRVTVEGIDADGSLGRQVYTYKVE